MNRLKVKRLSPAAIIPTRATEHSAGYDLYACIDEPLPVPARGRVSVNTGVAVEIENGCAGFVFGRSGLGIRHGLAPSNAVGVIDSDYRGEIIVGLSNHSDVDYIIRPSERVAQLLILPVLTPEIEECGELSSTVRGSGGFGSSGK